MNPHGTNTLPDKVASFLQAGTEPLSTDQIAERLRINRRSIGRAIGHLASERRIIAVTGGPLRWASREIGQ